MSKLTQKALAAALLEQLKEKPLDKITVIELTEMCGVTRNTFYYHFKDVYDLLSYIFINELEKVRRKYEADQNWEGGLEQTLDYLYTHRSAMKNLYESISKDYIIRYINDVAYEHALAIVRTHANGRVDDTTLEIVSKFYINALLGALTSWLVNGMKQKPDELSSIFYTMFRGTFDAAVEAGKEI